MLRRCQRRSLLSRQSAQALAVGRTLLCRFTSKPVRLKQRRWRRRGVGRRPMQRRHRRLSCALVTAQLISRVVRRTKEERWLWRPVASFPKAIGRAGGIKEVRLRQQHPGVTASNPAWATQSE
jgi:hypothetical protein